SFETPADIVEHRAASEVRHAVVAASFDLGAHRIDAVPQRAGGVELDVGGRGAEFASALAAMGDAAGDDPRVAEQLGSLSDAPRHQRLTDRPRGNDAATVGE